MLSGVYAEFIYTESYLPSVKKALNAECHKVECRYAECHIAF
jgi:hypothetical protein